MEWRRVVQRVRKEEPQQAWPRCDPSTDRQLAQAYAVRSARLVAEFPSTSPACMGVFQSYLCDLSFPQCVSDPTPGSTAGLLVEQPLCYAYCLSAELACGGNSEVAQMACDKAVAAGRVAPGRADVLCKSCAALSRARATLLLAAAAWLCTLL